MFPGTRPTSGLDVKQIVKEYPLVILSKKECFMAYATTDLLLKVGANPLLLEAYDMDHLRWELSRIVSAGDMREGLPLPLVFVGGRLIGGLDRVITMHVSAELVPLLKEAGALWL